MERIVSWFSCGAASAVATKLAISSGKDITIAYCKVKEEHPDNERFLNDCQEWFGQEIKILMNEKFEGSIFNVFKNHYLNTPRGAACTMHLKKNVRKKFQKPDDIQVFGYTVEEQDRVNRFIDSNNDVHIWPILIEKGLTKEDCLAMVENAGIDLPEMYKMGYRNNNCIGCVKGGIGYWNKIRKDFPEHFERMADLEKKKGCTVLKERILVDGSVVSKPLYLHDLEPGRGRYPSEPDISCGIFCHMAESEYLK